LSTDSKRFIETSATFGSADIQSRYFSMFQGMKPYELGKGIPAQEIKTRIETTDKEIDQMV
jgi:hypothetical protein